MKTYFSAPLLILSFLLTSFGMHAPESTPEEKPNFILILIDDLGWTDLSSQGSTYYETPHIDGLASQGIRFTNGYAACAVCSPSRAAVLTGRYPARVGITDWIRARFQGGDIPEDKKNPTEYVGEPDLQLLCPPNPYWMEHEEVTIAEVLRENGYATGYIGKWHLGPDEWYPETQGFDHNVGGCDFGQPPSYFDPYFREGQGQIPTLTPREEGEYLTDREADEAAAFIREHRDEPFFLQLAHYAVHTPIQAKEDLVDRYTRKPVTNQTDPKYAAMVHSVDESVGRILDLLDETGIANRTMVIFTSDNGGLVGPTHNAPLRSGKGFPYEGGIRVPVIIRWPEVIEAARVSYEPVTGVDYMPTILEAAGISPPEGVTIDGLSLLGLLRSGGEQSLNREAIYWHFPHYRQGNRVTPYSIVRSGGWKLIKWYEGPRFELYNIQEDLGETKDLAGERPDKVEELDAKLTHWLESTGALLPRPNPDYQASE